MYDASSRLLLAEKGDYEGWLIGECLNVLRDAQGVEDPLRIVISDTGTAVCQSFKDTFGAGYAAEVVRKLLPLTFTAAFKLLDMVIEWCLYENGIAPARAFFSFKQKIQHLQTSTITWPGFLDSDARLRQILIAAYVATRPKRNQLVHGAWGSMNNGNLEFNYWYENDLDPARPRVHDQDVVSETVIVFFSEFAAFIFARLVDPTKQSAHDVDTLRRLSNGFQTLHRHALISVSAPRLFLIVRHTELDSVSISEITNAARSISPGVKEIAIELTIEKAGNRWLIPPDKFSSLNGAIPLSDLPEFIVT